MEKQKLVLILKSTQASVADPSSLRPLGMIDSRGQLFERLILNRMDNVCEEEDNEGIGSPVRFPQGAVNPQRIEEGRRESRRLFTNYRAEEDSTP